MSPTSPGPAHPDLLDELERLEVLLTREARPNEHTAAVIAAARRHAGSVVAAGRGRPDAFRSGLVIFVADVLNGLWLEREWRPEDVDALLEDMHEVIGAPMEYLAMNVALRALSDPSLLELPPAVAAEAQIRMLAAFGPVTHVSLWGYDENGRLAPLFQRGTGAQSRRARELAAVTLADADGDSAGRGLLQAVPVRRWEMTYAVLIARPTVGGKEQCRACLREAAGILGPVFERQALLERNAARERTLMESNERHLKRLAFDLHDGPIQDVSALLTDVRLFRRQLRESLVETRRAIMLGRVEDLDARLVALDASLRELSHSAESSAAMRRPFKEVLEREIEAFRRSTRISIKLELSGDFDGLTNSQRIALLRIVQESLTNVREHSRAKHVGVRVRERHGHVEARIRDDGQGFEVERGMERALNRGRLGLLGMVERARLLGGRCEVQSRPGGPTTVAVALAKWEPAGSSGVAGAESAVS